MPTTLKMPTQEQWLKAEEEFKSRSSAAPAGLCTISATLILPLQVAKSDSGMVDAHFEFFYISTLFGESKLVVVPSEDAELGHGTYARVVRAIDKEGVIYALKIGFKAVEFFDVHERSILTELHELEASGYLDGNKPLLLMKLKQGRKLTALLPTLNRDALLQFEVAIKILQVLNVLAKKRIVHGDIKPDNIIIDVDKDQDGNLVVDVVDFGMAYKLGEADVQDRKVLNQIGTTSYMSPEGVRGEVSITSDLFSFACMLRQDFNLDLDVLNLCRARDYTHRPSVAAVLEVLISMERNLQSGVTELKDKTDVAEIMRILGMPEYKPLQSILLLTLLRNKNVAEHDLMSIAQKTGLLNELINFTIEEENYSFLNELLITAQTSHIELKGLTYHRVSALYFATETPGSELSVIATCYYVYAYFKAVIEETEVSRLVDVAASAMVEVGKFSFNETQVQRDLQPFIDHFSETDDALPLLGILFSKAINLSITYINMDKFYDNMQRNSKFRHSLYNALFNKDYTFISAREAKVLFKILPGLAHAGFLKEWSGSDATQQQKILRYLVNHLVQISKARDIDHEPLPVLFNLIQKLNSENQPMQRNFAADSFSSEDKLPPINIDGLLEVIQAINPEIPSRLMYDTGSIPMARAAVCRLG